MNQLDQRIPDPVLKVAIAGASGFVGRALISSLKSEFKIIGLSRSAIESGGGIEWRQCDLFNLRQTEWGLEGANVAIYLVHSMMPNAKLTQGNFADLDLVIADNFARAAKRAGVKRIIYLSGIIPNEKLSKHLESRLEVEKVLGSHDVPCIALRAGLIIGKNGSSFDIMRKLVERLPIMICPRWTNTKSQPVSLRDVVETIKRLIQRPDIPAGNYDLGRETFETCGAGYVLRENNRNGFPMGKCYLAQCAPERYLDANETYCQNYEAIRRTKQNYVKMWVNGDYLGQFWY